MLLDAVEVTATDVLIDPRSDDHYAVRFRIDGILEEIEQVDAKLAVNMLN